MYRKSYCTTVVSDDGINFGFSVGISVSKILKSCRIFFLCDGQELSGKLCCTQKVLLIFLDKIFYDSHLNHIAKGFK